MLLATLLAMLLLLFLEPFLELLRRSFLEPFLEIFRRTPLAMLQVLSCVLCIVQPDAPEDLPADGDLLVSR